MKTLQKNAARLDTDLSEPLERVLLLARVALTTARSDEELYRALDAVENASRNAILAYLDRRQDSREDEQDDAPF